MSTNSTSSSSKNNKPLSTPTKKRKDALLAEGDRHSGSSSSVSGQHHQQHHRTASGSADQGHHASASSDFSVNDAAKNRHNAGFSQHRQQQQQQQQQKQQHKKQQDQQRRHGRTVEEERKPKLLHEIAAKKYAAFLAEAPGHALLPPLSYYRRPRRKRQRADLAKALAVLRVPTAQDHNLPFSAEWRKPMTMEPEQLGAFLKPGGGVIEPTVQPPPELKMNGIIGKDLNQGFLSYVEPDTTSCTSEISEMLDETPGLEREEESAHFITYRNNLIKIIVAPYSKQAWEMEVFKEGGIIHLEVVSLDRNRMTRTSYYGRRFETLCVLGVEGTRLDELHRASDEPARSSYCGLYRSRLGSHNLLMGAEIDACRPADPGRFVKIKTTRLMRDSKEEQIFKKHKALKYWAQCYLAGVKELVVGYRDENGTVRDIKSWTTDGLVESVDRVKHWDKDVCLNFADRCLSFLKDNVDEGTRYSLKYPDPYEHLTLEQIAPSSQSAVVAGPSVGDYRERES